ncbi:hypothetical protein FSP39_003810 [Pinctada imbricata]|uniref:Caspase-3 n=1 Tax=Pinctada imbricata TaxID=66713 RepID=A0AA88XTC4_PINIB|nr:hypothetical protein FSP39_003810 [Pinctada imbricata]
MPKFSPKVKDKHNEIMTSLYDYINKAAEEHDYVKFKNRLKSRLPPLYIKLGENVTDYIDHLEKKGKIFPGNYKELKDILDGIDTRIVQLLEDGEEEIQQLISQEDNVSSTTVSDARPVSLETYPKEANQTGLIIIINFTKDREGSEQDGYKLESFFREVLGYVVKRKEDMTREGLLASLKEETSKLNDLTNRQKYHSIMVVVMSHGDKEGIVTHDDKRMTMEEIMEFFKNDKLKCFADRPKVFFVQACRGTDDQGTVDIPDDLPPVDIEDVVGSVPVPVDANILVAYATTPGYKAYRRPSSEIGAWFIHALIEVFKEMHTQCHLEDMLISVRAMLAEDPTFERSTKKTRQMPLKPLIAPRPAQLVSCVNPVQKPTKEETSATLSKKEKEQLYKRSTKVLFGQNESFLISASVKPGATFTMVEEDVSIVELKGKIVRNKVALASPKTTEDDWIRDYPFVLGYNHLTNIACHFCSLEKAENEDMSKWLIIRTTRLSSKSFGSPVLFVKDNNLEIIAIVIGSLVSGSRVEIVNKVVDDSPKGIKIVAEIHNEEVREAKIHKINDKDDKYQRSIESLYRNHPFTKESAVRLKMIGERKPVRMTKKERDITLDLHNELRMKEATEMGISDMPYLQWDNNLAEMAQALADTCVFEHYNIHRKGGVLIGQNLGYVVPNELQPMSHFRNIIQAFFDEKVDMNPVTFRCKRGTVCGHYRQMIYSQVKRIGCAFTTCSAIWHVYMKTRNPEFVYNPYTPSYPIFYGVCNYDQYADHNLALFHYGPPCSFCSADKKLPLNCVDSKRSPSLRASLCDQCDVDRTGCEYLHDEGTTSHCVADDFYVTVSFDSCSQKR